MVDVVDGEELYYAWHDMSEMTARLWPSMIGIVLVGFPSAWNTHKQCSPYARDDWIGSIGEMTSSWLGNVSCMKSAGMS